MAVGYGRVAVVQRTRLELYKVVEQTVGRGGVDGERGGVLDRDVARHGREVGLVRERIRTPRACALTRRAPLHQHGGRVVFVVVVAVARGLQHVPNEGLVGMTWSPTLRPLTPLPAFSTMPTPSEPPTAGNEGVTP